jgi:addiction module HigA family antidote
MTNSSVPLHPGWIIKETVLPRLGIGPSEAAEQLDVSRGAFSRVINGKADISPEMAIRLEAWVDLYTAEEWLLMQVKHTLWKEKQNPRPDIKRVSWSSPVEKELYKVQVLEKNIQVSGNGILGSKITECPASVKLDASYSFNIPQYETDFPSRDIEELRLIWEIGKRMQHARKINKFKIDFSAEKLGIETEFLKDIELGNLDEGELPLIIILKASMFYRVPLDYLFCITEDWDSSEEAENQRDFMSYCYFLMTEEEKKWNRKYYVWALRAENLAAEIEKLLKNVSELNNSFGKFKERNPTFIDMKAGSGLQRNIDSTTQRAQNVNHEMSKLRRAYIPRDVKNKIEL